MNSLDDLLILVRDNKKNKVNKKEANILIEHFEPSYDSILYDKINRPKFCKPYLLSNGMVLLFWETRKDGVLYSSADELLDDFREFKEDVSSITPGAPFDILPYKWDFPNHTEELIGNLCQLLKIDNKALDKSVNSLKLIDTLLLKIDRKDFMSLYYSPIVAYSGEVIIKEIGGKWEMRKYENKFKESWVPYIIGGDGRDYHPFFDVYKDYMERKPVKLYAIVLAEISKYTMFGDR